MKSEIINCKLPYDYKNYEPVLIQHIESGAVVFLGSDNEFKNGKFTSGTVINQVDNAEVLATGARLCNWDMCKFQLFKGEIKLSN